VLTKNGLFHEYAFAHDDYDAVRKKQKEERAAHLKILAEFDRQDFRMEGSKMKMKYEPQFRKPGSDPRTFECHSVSFPMVF
jgi:hypothetical protein